MTISAISKNMKTDKMAWRIFAVVTVLSVLVTFLAKLIQLSWQYDAILSSEFFSRFHFFLEIISIIISFSIFFMAIYSYKDVLNAKMLAAGYTFFAAGMLNTIHLASYSGNVLFIGPDNAETRSAVFLLLSRLYCSFGLALVCFLAEKRKKPLNLSFWGIVITVDVAFTIWISTKNPYQAKWFDHGKPLLISQIFMSITILLLFISLFLTLRNYVKRPDKLHILLATAFVFLISSELLLLTTGMNANFEDSIALFLKVIGSLVLFNVFYVHGIRRPFILLSEAKNHLNHYLNDMDKLVEQRTAELTVINTKLLEDVEMAKDVQRSMLPGVLPKEDTILFSVGFTPADELSGDFYNVFKIDENHYGFCIGDVAGHGVSAAMLTIFAFQSVQTLQDEPSNFGILQPAYVLKHLYDSFNSTNFHDEYYMVLFYAVYNTETGVLTYSNGGLNTVPYRVRPDGTLYELETDGMAICKMGEFVKPNYQNKQMLLFPGDKLVFYTDGLIEARSFTGEEYGKERLKETLLKSARLSIEETKKFLMHDVMNYTGLSSPKDDITLLLMEVTLPF